MSPTVQTLLTGFALLAIFIGAARLIVPAHGISRAVRVFYPVWFAYCVWHLSVGLRHGYTLMDELPFLLLNFAVPALAAWLVGRRWGAK